MNDSQHAMASNSKIRMTDLQVGDQLISTHWIVISQSNIEDFAKATGDFQWIHLDKQKCATSSPFKTTIAHGFLTSSLVPSQFEELVHLEPEKQTLINYGVDKIRFLEPVRSGDSIKFKFELTRIDDKPAGALYSFDVTTMIKNREKPALVGTFLLMLLNN
ncbi:MAG: MaoC/PaaZ C-terminal domain-containing protein [Pseudomonadota bacterium]